MTPIEIIALIMIILAVVKIIILLVNPGAWLDFAKSMWKNPGAVKVVGLVLAAITLYYLLQELNIVQIMAVMAFMASLIMVGFAPYVNPLMNKFEAQIRKRNIWQKSWLYTAIWIILLIWAAKELLM